jgi:chromosome partitioning protein
MNPQVINDFLGFRKMKTLLVAVNKGGVGKSMISCQLARYAQSSGLRVLFIDFDDQGNSSNHLLRDQIAQPCSIGISSIFHRFEELRSQIEQEIKEFNPQTHIILVPADGRLVTTIVEQSLLPSVNFEDNLNSDVFIHHMESFLNAMKPYFDLCIIDGAPTGDTRIVYGMAVADAVLSPIQLAQESLEGMGETLNGARGFNTLKNTYNSKLEFLGFLPNMLKQTSDQLAALEDIFNAYGSYVLRNQANKPCFIPESIAIKDAQGVGCSLQSLAKTNSTARRNWALIKPTFDLVLAKLGLDKASIDENSTNTES